MAGFRSSARCVPCPPRVAGRSVELEPEPLRHGALVLGHLRDEVGRCRTSGGTSCRATPQPRSPSVTMRRGLYPSPASGRLEKRLAALPSRRSCIRTDVEHHPVLVHRGPEMVQRAVDTDGNLIEVPGVARPRAPPPELLGEAAAELGAPAPDALVRGRDAPFGQDQLDVSQAQAEHVVEPNGVADDLGREAVPAVAGGIGRHHASLAQGLGRRQPRFTRQHPSALSGRSRGRAPCRPAPTRRVAGRLWRWATRQGGRQSMRLHGRKRRCGCRRYRLNRRRVTNLVTAGA